MKQPKASQQPSDKHVRTRCQPHENKAVVNQNPGSTDHETPAWQFNLCDYDHALWGWRKLSPHDFVALIHQHLRDIERMKWSDIKQAAGGRSRGTNSHPLPVVEFASDAKKRLQQLKLDDIDELFSLRLTSTLRLYGIRDGRVLKFIWHDPHHGERNKGAYPTKNN